MVSGRQKFLDFSDLECLHLHVRISVDDVLLGQLARGQHSSRSVTTMKGRAPRYSSFSETLSSSSRALYSHLATTALVGVGDDD